MNKAEKIIFKPSLVLYLPLWKKDGANFLSEDAYGHQSSVTGAKWTPQGRYFDGTDDVIIVPNKSCLQIVDDITIIAWIKPSANRVEGICTKYISGATSYLFRRLDTQLIQFAGHDGVTAYATSTRNTVPIGKFSCVGSSKQGGIQTVFINGNVDNQENKGAYKIAITTNDVWIGKYYDNTYVFTNLIGEVAIYNQALSPVEMRDWVSATQDKYA